LIPNAGLLASLSQGLEELLTTNIIGKNALAPDPRLVMGQIAPGYLMRMHLSRHVFLGLVPQPKLVGQVQLPRHVPQMGV
jgi:hypothetical protein